MCKIWKMLSSHDSIVEFKSDYVSSIALWNATQKFFVKYFTGRHPNTFSWCTVKSGDRVVPIGPMLTGFEPALYEVNEK